MIDITDCPRCGAPLEAGHLNGQGAFLMWTRGDDTVGPTTLGEEGIARGSLTNPPRLTASRCRTCGLGLFEVDGAGDAASP
jgi:uncharacterized Zn finger protein (UPF0148 family)